MLARCGRLAPKAVTAIAERGGRAGEDPGLRAASADSERSFGSADRSGARASLPCNTGYSGVVAVLLDDLPAAELRFHFKSGRLCLDFVATVGERWRRSFERLRMPEDLGRWLVEASLLSCVPSVNESELEDARRLRESIYRMATRVGTGRPQRRDLRELNRWAAKPPLQPRLGDDGRTVTWVGDRPVEAALAMIARDAADLLSGPLAARIRECAGPDCALLFVDGSRPGQRRWCSMEACGNRIKTAAYRRRRSSRSGKES
jgi:predicted RNA-binding Zn ribbon-like protein